MSTPDLANASLMDLFRLEAEEQSRVLVRGLLALERDPQAVDSLESCMRAAHSLKGAARIIDLTIGVSLAHLIESCFVAAQDRTVRLGQTQIDGLLRAVDLLRRIAETSEGALERWHAGDPEVRGCMEALEAAMAPSQPALIADATGPQPPRSSTVSVERPSAAAEDHRSTPGAATEPDRVLRVTADSLNRLLGLAGESLVASRRLRPFCDALLRLKRQHQQISHAVQELRQCLPNETASPQIQSALAMLESRTLEARADLDHRLSELDTFDRRVASLSRRMYDSAVASRMRPFADGTHAFSRMVRDLGRSLGKSVRLEISGTQTQVDREVLEKLEAPLGHLLRNAVDHGIETAERRRAAGKPEIGLIRLDARHTAGRLVVVVSDDGTGIDREKLRTSLIARQLATDDTAARMSDAELFAFLLLPGFSLAPAVTEVSGRGVGLDVVHDMLKQLRGIIRISSEPGAGSQFLMQLPLTLSIVRALIVEVSGEPYALPLASIVSLATVTREQITYIEGKPCFQLNGVWVGLVSLHQLLETPGSASDRDAWHVVLVSAETRTYGLAVDRLMGEKELVVRSLDPRLGKIRDISAAALQDDGSPVLILDGEDLIRSADKLAASGQIASWGVDDSASQSRSRPKRILVVEDSLTVRELERKLLSSGGYEVDVAVDGMDGWNAVRGGDFDLVLTDIDMPRMDGIELVTLIKRDARLSRVPVMIVSYKDRPEDRDRGLQAGADYYLAKGSFHDQKLLSAVVDLIGGAQA